MKKIVVMSLVMMLAACGTDTSSLPNSGGSSSSSGTNSTTLDATNLNTITITTTSSVSSSGTYFHVYHGIDNASLNRVFFAGTNDPGTLVTTCVRGAATTISVAYTCTSSYAQIQSPLNIPDAVQTVNFNIGETYQVYQVEKSLQVADRRTSVGSFTMQ